MCRATIQIVPPTGIAIAVLPLRDATFPYRFVDQLDVQVPQTTALSDAATGRVRVILGVSGQWQAGK
jgi:hypothetical protein